MIPEPFNFSDHLEELRKRLLIVLAYLTGLSILSLVFSDGIVELVTTPIKSHLYSLYFLTPYEAFLTKLKVSFLAGIILSLPVIFYQLWLFAAPGLYPSEKKVITPLVLISTGLFVAGVLFAYFLVIPFALSFFLGFQTDTLVPLISIGSYLSFFISVILVFGVLFDLPVLLVGLIWLGVIGAEFLASQRKPAIVIIFILAAVLTPTVDLITQCLLAVPLWLLFELSIVIGRMIEKRKNGITVSH